MIRDGLDVCIYRPRKSADIASLDPVNPKELNHFDIGYSDQSRIISDAVFIQREKHKHLGLRVHARRLRPDARPVIGSSFVPACGKSSASPSTRLFRKNN